jgi:cytochrome oxidase Cu insertion factor (SCO1/SenC/PrrC family)
MNTTPDPSMNAVDPAAVPRRSRTPLVLMALVFIAPVLVAGALVLAGWHPQVAGEGEPILPQRNFAQEGVQIVLEDGETWPWRDSKPRLTLLAVAGPDCASRCMTTITHLAEARLMLNQNQPRLRLLYVGAPPAAAESSGMYNYWQVGRDVHDGLAAFRPSEPDTVNAILVESNGTALSLYPAGTDGANVLRDLRKVIR